MMKTSNSLTKRVISFLLTVVMVIGLLPTITFDAQAAVSFNGISNPQEYTGNGPKYGFSYWPDTYGAFTRFSIVRINTPDNDSVTHDQVDETENAVGDPSSGSNQLFSNWEQLRDFSNYEVIGSVDIGSSTQPVAQAALNAYWYDTTAMGYTQKAVEHTSDRQAAIVHYIESKEQLNFSSASSDTTRKGFFSWDKWCNNYPGCKDLELPSWIADGSSSSIEKLFSVWGETGTSEDVKQFASSNAFVNSLLAYLGGDELKKENGFWVEEWQQNISNFFSVKDKVTYRIVVEPGIIVKNINTNPSSYYAMTARDIAAVGLMLDVYGDDYYGFAYDMTYSALQDVCNCLRGLTNEFHGYYWDEKLNTFVVTNKDDRGGLFKGVPSETTAKGKELRNLLFGMNTSGTATESEHDGFPQYALLFITPYFNGKQSQSFKMQKILNGGTEEDKNYEWEFEVVLDQDAEGEIIYVSADGTRSEPHTISFAIGESVIIKLKGGESCEITGWPRNAQ